MEPLSVVIFIVILLFSVIFHEVAHGLVAERLGDSTARYAGRLTLNPIPHIDPVGSILLPLLMWVSQLSIPAGERIILGAAKPVPVDYRNLRNVRLGMILISIAGPITNFILAVVAAAVLRFAPNLSNIGEQLLVQVIILNLVLTVFNMIPVPPLDGSKILAGILGYINRNWMHSFLALERFGFILVILLLVTGVFGWILGPSVSYLYSILVGV